MSELWRARLAGGEAVDEAGEPCRGVVVEEAVLESWWRWSGLVTSDTCNVLNYLSTNTHQLMTRILTGPRLSLVGCRTDPALWLVRAVATLHCQRCEEHLRWTTSYNIQDTSTHSAQIVKTRTITRDHLIWRVSPPTKLILQPHSATSTNWTVGAMIV